MSANQGSFRPVELICEELSLPPVGVAAVLHLLDEGNTIPFIARYRKEMTNNLDEVQIRDIQEKYQYLKELGERRDTILKSIEEQGKLTDDLKARLLACTTKTALEDLYLPYKPKRRTRATIARERGLEPLAALLLAQGSEDVEATAQTFVNTEKEVPDVKKALAGARDIVAEQISENAEIRAMLRKAFLEDGVLRSEVDPEKKNEPTKFEQYYEFEEPVATIPSHRFLAIQRGEREKILRVHLDVDSDPLQRRMSGMMGEVTTSTWSEQMQKAVKESYRRLLSPAVETEVRVELKMRSDRAAVDVFAENLRNVLMEPPFGQKAVIGIDPGLRTGCKCVALTDTGLYLDTTTIYLHQESLKPKAAVELINFINKYKPIAIAVGNGTAGRETERFVRQTLKEINKQQEIIVVLVNESGASIYSASDVARDEFPDLDLTIRGSISIARRLQDPLSELVKIDPKSIGVGQYQHDVFQTLLQRKLDEVVESCVNSVGVELNTASAPLLSYVAGIGKSLAKKIVKHRERKGSFDSREALLKVAGMGPKTYEQAAGFLRVRNSNNPLDSSAVHPERYDLIERIAGDMGLQLADLLGSKQNVDRIEVSRYVGEDVGAETLKDIVQELKKPGRDPRATFEPPKFRDDVNSIEDLRPGMVLEGVVTNVTAFGAFVDIGVKQDGLVHISQLADHFVREPSEVVKTNQKLKVTVLDVDRVRKRISLSARSDAREHVGQGSANPASRAGGAGGGGGNRGGGGGNRGGGRNKPRKGHNDGGFSNNPFANLLKR